MGFTYSLLGGSLAMRTAAPCPCAMAEDVESLGSPRGCPSGLSRWVYAGQTPASSISSTSCCNISRPPSSLHALLWLKGTHCCRQVNGLLMPTTPRPWRQNTNVHLKGCSKAKQTKRRNGIDVTIEGGLACHTCPHGPIHYKLVTRWFEYPSAHAPIIWGCRPPIKLTPIPSRSRHPK